MYFMWKLHPPKIAIDPIILLGLVPMNILLLIVAGNRAAFGFIAFQERIFAVFQVGLCLQTRNIYFIWLAVALVMSFIFVPALLVIMALGIVISTISGQKVMDQCNNLHLNPFIKYVIAMMEQKIDKNQKRSRDCS